MSIRKRGPHRYEIAVQVAGHRTYGTARTHKEARELEAHLKARLHEDHHRAKVGRPPRRLLSEAIIRWLDEECPRLKACRDFTDHLRTIEPYVHGVLLEDALSAVESIRRALAAKDLAPATINRRLAIIRRILNLAHDEWGWLVDPLGRKVRLLPERNTRHIYLTREQVAELVEACPPGPARDGIRVLAYTGLRRGELLGLREDQVREDVIILDAGTKSGRPRVVPIPPAIADVALPIPGISEYKLRKGFEAARAAVGLQHVHLHDLRHTYASWLIQAGASLTAVRDLLGHANLSVTDRYAHLAESHLREAVRGLSAGNLRPAGNGDSGPET